jgi:hypothetical protein
VNFLRRASRSGLGDPRYQEEIAIDYLHGLSQRDATCNIADLSPGIRLSDRARDFLALARATDNPTRDPAVGSSPPPEAQGGAAGAIRRRGYAGVGPITVVFPPRE